MPSRGKAARTVLESNSSLQEAGNAWLLTILCRSDGGNDFSKTRLAEYRQRPTFPVGK